MYEIIASGNIRLEKDDTDFSIFVYRGSFYNSVINITLDHFDNLLFVAKGLGYNATNLCRSGLVAMNEVSIKPTLTDEYDIKLGLNSLTLCETDMESLMKCLKYFEGYEKDNLTLEYGLKKDDRQTVKTVREGKLFQGYSPNITGNYFGISVEDNAEVKIYLSGNIGEWVDIFTLSNVYEVNHLKQVFCLFRESIEWKNKLYMETHRGVFTYDPEHDDLFVEVSTRGEKYWFDEEKISDLIRVIDRMN